MDIKTILPITELRKKLFNIIDKVEKTGAHFMITEKGRPKAVIMSAEEFESWIETFEIVKEFPDLSKEIEEFERDIKSGKHKSYPTFEEVIHKRNFIFADKPKRKYDISNKIQTKSGKRT